ncbi:MAG: hypothetical protein AAF213_09250 [Pseudomonadota bacterium]
MVHETNARLPQPPTIDTDGSAYQRRMVQGAKILGSALAAAPFAAAVSAEEAAFHAFTGPQAYVTQVQGTPDNGPVAQAPVQSPGEAGFVCISAVSANHPTAVIAAVSPQGLDLRALNTTGPGTQPVLPEGVECVSQEAFNAGLRERLLEFAYDTAVYAKDVAERANMDTTPIGLLAPEALPEDPLAAYQLISQVYVRVNRNAQGRLGSDYSDPDVRAAMMEQARHRANEVGMAIAINRVMPAVQENLDRGDITVGPDGEVILSDNATAIPINFVPEAQPGAADDHWFTQVDMPATGAGVDAPAPGETGQVCITHALADQPKGAYVEFDLNYGLQPSVMPVRLTEIGVMPNLPGKHCMTLDEFRQDAEARTLEFGRDLIAAARTIAEDTGRPEIARGVEVLENPAALEDLMAYAAAAETVFRRAAGADASLWQSDLPARGIAQRKEAFMIESMENGIPEIENDLRNPQTELQVIPINLQVPNGAGLDGWRPRQAVLRQDWQPAIVPVQAQVEAPAEAPAVSPSVTPGQRGSVCVTYESATSGEQRLVIANPTGSATSFYNPADHGAFDSVNWNGLDCVTLEAFKEGATTRAIALGQDVADFVQDVATATERPELAAGIERLRDPSLADDLTEANRVAALTLKSVSEAVEDVDPLVLRSAVAPERLDGIMQRGLQGYVEQRLMTRVESALNALETRYGPRVEGQGDNQPIGQPINFEGTGDGYNIREWRIRRDGPKQAATPLTLSA